MKIVDESRLQGILRRLIAVVFILGALVSIWFFLTNLNSVEPTKAAVLLVFGCGVVLLMAILAPTHTRRIKALAVRMARWRYSVPLVVLLTMALGLAIRWYCFVRFSYDTSLDADPDAIYLAAQAIACGTGISGDVRTASCAYLASYMNLLSFFIGAIKDSWLAIIVLNTLFDFCGAILAMLLVRKMTAPGSRVSVLVFALWFLSPFNLIFSLISLPISAVNTCIVAVVFVCLLFTEQLLKKRTAKALLLALITGMVMGIANCFRPIFPVAIIAFVIFMIFVVIRSGQAKKLVPVALAAVVIILVPFNLLQLAQTRLVTAQTGIEVPSNPGAFSFYVGANRESNGRFNSEDWRYRQEVINSSPSLDAAYDRLQEEALDRYGSYGALETLDLFANKLYEFSNRQDDMYNANATLIGYKGSRTAQAFTLYLQVFCAILYIASALMMLRCAKRMAINSGGAKRNDQIVLFLTILLLGFFLSHAFVEAAHRYAQIMYPLFMVLSVCLLDSFSTKAKPSQKSS